MELVWCERVTIVYVSLRASLSLSLSLCHSVCIYLCVCVWLCVAGNGSANREFYRYSILLHNSRRGLHGLLRQRTAAAANDGDSNGSGGESFERAYAIDGRAHCAALQFGRRPVQWSGAPLPPAPSSLPHCALASLLPTPTSQTDPGEKRVFATTTDSSLQSALV